MKLKIALVTLGAAALMIPGAGAVAASGKSGDARSQHAKKGKNKGKGKSKAKNAVFGGVVKAVDAEAGTVTVLVERASSHGRRFEGSEVVFTLAGVKKLGVRDSATDADEEATLADVALGDKAHVQARVTKDSASPLAARKFKVQYPEADAAPAPTPTP